MGEIPLPYQPDTFCLQMPPVLKRGLDLAVMAEASSPVPVLEVLNPKYKQVIKSLFGTFIKDIYTGLQDPKILNREELYRIVEEKINSLTSIVSGMSRLESQKKGWAYSLTLSRAWTVLDLIFQAHKGIEYKKKKAVRFMISNYYPSVLGVFKSSGLPLSDFEAEIVSDLCMGASARDGRTALAAAKQMVSSLRESSLAKRSGQTERLGDDFLEVLLSIKYTKPTEKKT